MKRTKFTYMLILAALMASCTKDQELVEVSSEVTYSDNEIIFSGSTSQSTKGTVAYDSNLDSMGIYSYATTTPWGEVTSGSDVMAFFNDYNDTYPVLMYLSSSVWTHDLGTKYWPSDGTYLTFYGWAPYGRINRVFNQTTGRPDFSHTLSGDAIINRDLLWAPAVVDQTHGIDEQTNTTGIVTIDYDHAMTALSLNARVLVSEISRAARSNQTYERFGINGITFYKVASEADVEYDETTWEPSWSYANYEDDAYPNNISHIDITAAQGNTLADHENLLYTNGAFRGQVLKVDEDYIEYEELINKGSTPDSYDYVTYSYVDGVYDTDTQKYDTFADYIAARYGVSSTETTITNAELARLTFENTMRTVTDPEGLTETYGIFMLPQTFSEGKSFSGIAPDGKEATPISPDANIRVRLRHYANTLISKTEYEATYGTDYTNCVDYVFTNAEANLTGSDVNGSPAVDTEPYIAFNTQFYFQLSTSEGTSVASGSFISATEYLDGDYDEYDVLFQDLGDGLATPTPYVLTTDGSYSTALENSIQDDYYVLKDQNPQIYATVEIPMTDIFVSVDDFPNGWKAGDWIELYCTFDLTSTDNYDIPMSVYAKVFDWQNSEVYSEVQEPLLVYCDTQTVSSGNGTVTIYTNYEGPIESADISYTGIFSGTATEVIGTSTAISNSTVSKIYSYDIPVSVSGTSGEEGTISVVFNHNNLVATKVFTLTLN